MTTMTDVDVHRFAHAAGHPAWICECGRSRNSGAHRGDEPRPSRTPAAHLDTVATRELEPGTRVLTTEQVGTDFGLPLVEPTRRRRGTVVRTVRNHVKCQGGTVVWFADGTKSRPVNGRTGWLVAGE